MAANYVMYRPEVETLLEDEQKIIEIQIQLNTDLEKMPVEDANKDWDQKESPYLPVGRIRLPKQEAYSEARQKYIEALSFSPAHCLKDFRPLGSIMRARLQAYPVQSRIRRQGNGQAMLEPGSIEAVPA